MIKEYLMPEKLGRWNELAASVGTARATNHCPSWARRLFFRGRPLYVAGLVPWWITGLQLRPPFLSGADARHRAPIMILAGVPGSLDAFCAFRLQGLGTPAPSRRPGIRGDRSLPLCAYPIYIAVVADQSWVEAVLMGDWRSSSTGALLWLLLPRLGRGSRRTHRSSRRWKRVRGVFRAAVPRWIPADDPVAVE